MKASQSGEAKYLVAESWGHCFVGSKESTVRWVYEIGGSVIAGHVKTAGGWERMHRAEMADVCESLHDNNIPDTLGREFEGVVVVASELPEWATADKLDESGQRASTTVFAEQLTLATKALKSFWANQRRRGKFGTVMTLRLSDAQGTLVGWMVCRSDKPLRNAHPFTSKAFGWNIERERAFDDQAAHRRSMKVSPESEIAEEVPA